ncbi:unnamed protein product [Didymodactylos carnosus]|uniref:DDE-1 domain-containing protein n=1 Tax=Didymodactylos carnosus TaxID=1234261 RepID=A0A815HPM8_9BILA|nr:unnamed protein product [Didymodactylos carnosus]CAF1357801.1 unnamed protein product [Didymodactylos carnosus]CAF3798076.1 unnamed protein product [Didymodactylos carnosus]CAF4233253.1 unnamed protein product [Didymodactylos carnosus]
MYSTWMNKFIFSRTIIIKESLKRVLYTIDQPFKISSKAHFIVPISRTYVDAQCYNLLKQNLCSSWCCGGPSGTEYTVSGSGWMNEELFTWWFTNSFIAQTQHLPRPLLLVLDGLGAHVNVTCIELAIANNIILLVLPPHTTHNLQPLDLVILDVVKSYWYKIMSSYKKQGYNAIRKPDFPGLINHVYEQVCTKRQVVSSFAPSGIWPFDNQAMKDKVAVEKRQKRVSLNVTTLSTCQDDVSTSSFSTMSTDTY